MLRHCSLSCTEFVALQSFLPRVTVDMLLADTFSGGYSRASTETSKQMSDAATWTDHTAGLEKPMPEFSQGRSMWSLAAAT